MTGDPSPDQTQKMPTSLVTGGAGFIGAHLTRRLLDLGHEVTVLDDLSGGRIDNIDRRAAFCQGSVVDSALVDELFAEHKGFDYVYHCAAYAAENLSHFVKRFNYVTNLVGSVNLINAAVNHGVQCFVFLSSIAVYGAGQLPLTEEMHPDPDDSYGIAKLAVERDLVASHRMFGLNYVIFRPHNVYGPMQNIGDKYRNVVGIFVNQIMCGTPLSIFGDGEQTRAFSYVDDIVPLIADAPTVEAAHRKAFNIGADTPYTVNRLADTVRRAMGVPEHPIVHYPARDEAKHAFSDHSKLRSVFGGAATTDLETGVSRMVAWASAHGPQVSTPFENLEIHQKLPSAWRDDEQTGGSEPPA
jgi:UDP-glucose 4-epimerase